MAVTAREGEPCNAGDEPLAGGRTQGRSRGGRLEASQDDSLGREVEEDEADPEVASTELGVAWNAGNRRRPDLL
jgi:hypothetical protein